MIQSQIPYFLLLLTKMKYGFGQRKYMYVSSETECILHVSANYTGHSFHLLLDSLHEKYGKTFRMQLLGECLVTEDPDAIATIHRHEGNYPRRAALNLFEVYAEKNDKERGMAVVWVLINSYFSLLISWI